MLKQLFFSLLLTTTAIHSMDLMLCNPNIGPHVTQQLRGQHYRRYLWAFKDDIASLSLTNKALCAYYTSTAQDIVRMIARSSNRSDEEVAQFLGQKTIQNKIKDLFSVIENKQYFTPQDLQDRWHLTATTAHWRQNSLLHAAIHAGQVINVAMLTHRIDDINADSNVCSLWSTFMSPLSFTRCEFYSRKLFIITLLLLQKNANPDDRPCITSLTPLMACIWENHKESAQLLLERDANPYALFFNRSCYTSQRLYDIEQAANQYSTDNVLYIFDAQKPWLQNAFHQGNEESQKWFREMVKEVNKRKKAKL